MTRRSMTLALAAAGLATLAATPALSAPKTMSGSYSATAFPPDPTPIAGTTCHHTIPQSMHTRELRLPAPGSLKVETVNQLDWTIRVIDDKGRDLGCSDGGDPRDKEQLTIKVKRAQVVKIIAGNWAGEPQITVKYKYTY